eukprot:GHVU01182010.1.p1 GENE.GHVU01182010.1~~GHVU01182010.1.p1  ORF type:complete len:340 (+),score=98.86 GHVU01182010.1:82-1020(+)
MRSAEWDVDDRDRDDIDHNETGWPNDDEMPAGLLPVMELPEPLLKLPFKQQQGKRRSSSSRRRSGDLIGGGLLCRLETTTLKESQGGLPQSAAARAADGGASTSTDTILAAAASASAAVAVDSSCPSPSSSLGFLSVATALDLSRRYFPAGCWTLDPDECLGVGEARSELTRAKARDSAARLMFGEASKLLPALSAKKQLLEAAAESLTRLGNDVAVALAPPPAGCVEGAATIAASTCAAAVRVDQRFPVSEVSNDPVLSSSFAAVVACSKQLCSLLGNKNLNIRRTAAAALGRLYCRQHVAIDVGEDDVEE